MKVLIVDDEHPVRIMVSSMLQELYPNQMEIFEAKNGSDGLETIKKCQPDIIFVDVKMPVMDGISMLKEGKAHWNKAIFIILTSYREFEYIKAAIHYGAFDYCMKPIDIDALKEVVDRAIAVLKNQTEDLQKIFSSKVHRYFNSADSVGLSYSEQAMESNTSSHYRICLIHIDGMNSEALKRGQHFVNQRLRIICSESPELNNRYSIGYLQSGELSLITDSISIFSIRSLLKKLITDISVRTQIMISEEGTLKDIYIDGQTLSGLTSILILYENNAILMIDELKKDKFLFDKLPICHNLYDLTAMYQDGQFKSAKKRIEEIFADKDLSVKYDLLLENENLCSFFKYSWGEDFDLSNWKKLLMQLDKKIECNSLNDRDSDTVEKVMRFVELNYQDDVGIDRMADVMGISPTYFSRMFHERTGKKYKDYVIELRIQKAIEILESCPDISVKKLAEKVGYLSSTYFSKVFFKYTGKLPSDYKK